MVVVQNATKIIIDMIRTDAMNKKYGMLNLDELKIENKEILDEAIKLSDELLKETIQMLEEHRDMHQAIVDVLLEKETISGELLDEIYKKYTNKEVETISKED